MTKPFHRRPAHATAVAMLAATAMLAASVPAHAKDKDDDDPVADPDRFATSAAGRVVVTTPLRGASWRSTRAPA